jgi:hypothetical protein
LHNVGVSLFPESIVLFSIVFGTASAKSLALFSFVRFCGPFSSDYNSPCDLLLILAMSFIFSVSIGGLVGIIPDSM